MGFRWPTMPGSGTQVAQQIGAIGAGIGALGEELNAQQAEVEYQDFKLRQKARINTLGDTLEQNTDENTYQKETDKVIAQMQSDMPKNGLAKRFASSWVKNEIPHLNKATNESIKSRIRDKSDVRQGELIEDAIRSGNVIDLAEHTAARVGFGYITGEQARKVMTDTRHKAERWDAQQIALGPDPDVILDNYTTAQELQSDYPTLTAGDFQDIRSSAQGQKRNLEVRKLQRISSHRVTMQADAQNLQVSPLDQFTEIQKLGLNPDEENELFEEFKDARKMIVDGLGSPYDKTMNPARLVEMRKQANLGKLTEKQISDAEGKSDGISLPHAEDLRKRIAKGGTAQNFRDSNMAETFLARLKSDERFDVRGIEENQGLRWLEAWSIAHPDATQREADEQALRVYERVVREDIAGTLPTTADELEALRIGQKGVIRKGMEELDKIDLAEIRKRRQGAIRVSGRIIVNPTTGERRRWDGTKWVTL